MGGCIVYLSYNAQKSYDPNEDFSKAILVVSVIILMRTWGLPGTSKVVIYVLI
jgi:hypothetical protein